MKKGIMSLLTFILVLNTQPVLQGGQFYLPLRQTMEGAGYKVMYDENITASTKDNTSLLVINANKDTYLDFKMLAENKQPILINDLLYMPVELLNTLGYDVTYNVTTASTSLEEIGNAN